MKIAPGLAMLLACASSALAEPTPPSPAPSAASSTAPTLAAGPHLEMELLRPYGGTWTCEGTAPATPFGPARKIQATVRMQTDLEGFWQTGINVQRRTPENPHPRKVRLHRTWDTTAKQYTELWLDNTGAWGSQSTPGWKADNTMVWTGDAELLGVKARTRDTYANDALRQLHHTLEVQLAGEWTLVADETCKRGRPSPAQSRQDDEMDTPAASPAATPVPSPTPKKH